MRRYLAFVLIMFTVFGSSVRCAFGSTDHMSRKAEKFKNRLSSLPIGTRLQVRLRDHRQVDGVLEARSEDGIELASPESVLVSYTEVKSLSEGYDGQSTPGQNQNSSAHHSHHLRTFLIVFSAGAVLLIVLAAAAK